MNPSDRERQKTRPPRTHSTDPAQPMKRAAPSSNLTQWQGEEFKIDFKADMYLSSHQDKKQNKKTTLLLSNKERIKEVSGDPVSIYGAGSHATQTYGKTREWQLPNRQEKKKLQSI